ncbi:MAG: SHOCT domain-containing protein, partial [Roseiarcus sp.]
MLGALAQGNGCQAQFNHPDLGGMGQWSQGGMIMIGDMFNQGLKHRVDALCSELAGLLNSDPSLRAADAGRVQSQSQGGGVSLFVAGSGSTGRWWPAELGSPASTGAQNDLRYA